MRIIIDGYNLIRRVPGLARLDREDLAQGRDALLRALSEYRARRGHRIILVFDGAGAFRAGRDRHKAHGIDVVFSAPGESADAVLREYCARQEADLLVSADRDVASACAARGVTVVAPDRFWEQVEEERMRRLKGGDPADEDEKDKTPRPTKRRLSKRRRKDMARLSRL